MALLEEFPFEPGFRLQDGDLLNKVAAEPAYSVDNTVTATGTTQATAYNLRATTTIVTGGADQTGLRLPVPKVGRILYIWNYTASGKRVYPHATETINNASTADIPFAEGMVIICTGPNAWSATQSTTNTTGDVILDASDADTTTGQGHLVNIQGGAGGTTSGSGGTVTIAGGAAIAGPPGNGGGINLFAGDSKGGTGGSIIAHAGNPGGLISLETNATNVAFPTKASGLIQLFTGASKDAASGVITLATGPSSGIGASGAISIGTGAASAVGGASGALTLATGSTTDAQASGSIAVTAGKNTGTAAGGSVAISAGTGTPGGKVTITSPGGPVGLVSGFTVGVAPNSTFTVTPGATANDPAVGTVSGTGGLQLASASVTVGVAAQNALVITPGATVAQAVTLDDTGTAGIQVATTAFKIGSQVTENTISLSSSTVLTGAATITLSGTGPLVIQTASLQVGAVGATANRPTLTPGAAPASPATFGVSQTGGIQVTTTMGFNNTPPVAKPTVTGSRGGNAALASLLTALAAAGLLTDTTTA